ADKLPAVFEQFLALLKGIADKLSGWLEEVVAMAVQVRLRLYARERVAGGGAGGRIGERQQHPDQGQAIGDTVVNPGDNGGATLVAVDQVNLPKGHVIAQWGAVEVGREFLQLELAAIASQ